MPLEVPMGAELASNPLSPREGLVVVNEARLFYREIGQGRPVVVLHGGPDFDHTYLLPDLDRLAEAYRLIYYDQRGRGRSVGEVENISFETELEDLDGLRRHWQLDTVAVLGHSWGGVLALAYALGHPERVSHLILLNTAPASQADMALTRAEITRRTAIYAAEMNALRASAPFAAGDPATVAAYYQLRFSTTIRRPEHLARLDLGYGHTTADDVLRAWAIEARLYAEAYDREGYDLIPQLHQLRCPTLVLHGDYDFIPLPCAARIAEAIPGARLEVLAACGHFAYLEAPEAVRRALGDFFANT